MKLTVDEKEISPDSKGVASVIRQPGPCTAKLAAKKQDGTDVGAEGNAQVQSGQTARVTLNAT